jgi:predicted HAD superfamily Cof-like phosphohydrolase|tara:strand:- start:312 stop:710 length:399 start_codon:yes stop_codon:yes gene_type:complete
MITQEDIHDFTGIDTTPLDMVREFTYSMGQPLDEKHGFSRKLEDMRWSLIKEEFAEVRDAVGYSEILKELADLVYVTYGYAATYGWDLDEAVRRVHKSNMSKLGVDGKPLKRPDGKVLKGPNYKKPDLTDLV